jgi:dolichol-phosphate mannosyltransferase
MDCDLQDRPEEIINLYNKAQEGYDFVVARRESRHDSKMKVFVSNCFYSVYSFATNVKYDPSLCNFSICSRKVIENYCRMREMHRGYTMYLLWMGFKWTALNVDHDERYSGHSSYNMSKRLRMAFELLTSQSDKPLRMMATLGMIISIISFVFVMITIIRHFTRNIAVGYSSQIAMTALMGGMTIMSVGIAGIYIGNIFMEVKHRPLYIIRSILNKKEEKQAKSYHFHIKNHSK